MGPRRALVSAEVVDFLGIDGEDMTLRPYRERRSLLESLGLRGQSWIAPQTFDDGERSGAVCEHGLGGVVAKRLTSRYRPGQPGWVKVKNRKYWTPGSELEAMQLAAERRTRRRAKAPP